MFKQTDTKRVLFVHTLRRLLLGLFVFLVLGGTLSGLINSTTPVNAATNNTINFQARLLGAAGNVAPDGNYNVEFKIYNAESSSGSSQGTCTGDAACLWTETRTSANRVRVANGYLSVALGGVTAFPGNMDWSQDLWLTMNIGGSTLTASWDGEMDPRLHLTAVPYAMSASNAVRASTADILQNNGANASTLGWVAQTAVRSILLPDASGTVCLAGTEGCGFALNGGNTTAASFTIGTNDNYGLNLEVNNTTVASFTNSGAATFKNTTNSTTAFDIQNAGSSSLFKVDTTNSVIALGSGGNTDVTIYNNGANGAWATNANALPESLHSHTTVTANGYVYVLGGNTSAGGTQSAVYYARLNADGSTGAWSTNSNALPNGREGATSITSNGYIYVMGGYNAPSGVGAQSTVYYAKLNADGSTGAWSTNSNALPAARAVATSVTANGYVYVMGGAAGSQYDTVYYAKLNADGSTGAWATNSNALPNPRAYATSVTANGYVYVISGNDQTSVFYAKLNADGSVGAWSGSGNVLPAGRTNATSVTANGYMYVMGGELSSVFQSTVYYAKLNTDGTPGVWATSANALPAVRVAAAATTSNGYVYVIGGWGASGRTDTTYYSKLQTTTVNGSAIFAGSVAGAEAQNTNEFTTLGQVQTLMAGAVNTLSSTAILNSGNSFGSAVTIGTNDNYGMNFEVNNTTVASFSNTGAVLYKNTSNSTSAFDIQNAGSTSVLKVDTTNSRISIGANGTATAQLYVSGSLPAAPTGTYSDTMAAGPVVVQGDYAYIMETNTGRVRIVNVSDPANPTEMFMLGTGVMLTRGDIAVQGDYLYMGGEGGGGSDCGLVVADVSNPADPFITDTLCTGDYDGGIAVQGNYVYQMGGTFNSNLRVIDVSDPTNVSVVSTTSVGSGDDIIVRGKYAYVVNSVTSGAAFRVVDISDPTDPTVVGTINAGTTTSGLYQPSNFALNGHYAYIGQNTGAANPGRIVDINDPTAPVVVGSQYASTAPTKTITQGTRLYFSSYGSATITAFDITDPLAPSLLGTVGGTEQQMGMAVQGRYLYVSRYWDAGAALAVYDMGGAYIQNLEVGGVQATGLSVDGDAFLAGNTVVGGGISVGGSGSFAGDVNAGGKAAFGGSLTVGGDLAASGSAFFKDTADSTTAFRVQNAAGQNVLAIDTTNNTLSLGTGATDVSISNNGANRSWVTESDTLPANRESASMVTANGYVYALGGDDGSTVQSTVYYAKLNADGSTGSWNTNSNALPAARTFGNAIVLNGYMYFIGGATSVSGNPPESSVYYAKINGDGSLGTWSTTTSLPAVRRSGSVVAANGHIYYLVGSNGGATQDTVYYAKVNLNGGITSWTTNGSTGMGSRAGATASVYNGYIYLVGGYGGSGALDTVQSAKLNSDGSVGNWSVLTNMPAARSAPTGGIAGGYLYVAGGWVGGAQSTLYYSKLNDDGTVGSWTTSASALPSARYYAVGSVIYNGYMYVVGGANSSDAATNTVYYSALQRTTIGGSTQFTGSVSGDNALNTNEFTTLGQVQSLIGNAVGSSVLLQGGNSFGTSMILGTNDSNGIEFRTSGNSAFIIDAQGRAVFQSVGNYTSAFTVKTAGGTTLLNVNTQDSQVTVQADFIQTSGNISTNGGVYADDWLELGTTGAANFTTPQGSVVTTKFKIALYNPGAFNQIMAMGLPSGAASSARVISIFDNRSGTNQPPLAVFAPNENNLAGIGWDGQNTRAYLKNTASEVGIRVNSSTDAAYFDVSGIHTIYGLTVGTNTTLDGTLGVGGAATLNGAVLARNTSNSTTAFDIQNAGTQSLFRVDTTNALITIGTGVTTSFRIGDVTNNTTYDSSTGASTLNGNARRARTIMLQPEYVGAILDAANDATCSSANSGTLTSTMDLSNRKNYYNWSSTSGSAQCYNVVVQVPIPTDFSAWATTTPLKVNARTTNTSNGTANIELRDSTGSVIYNYVSVTPGSTNTWTETTVATSISGTYTAGDYLTLRVRVSSQSSANIQLGAITMNYLSKW